MTLSEIKNLKADIATLNYEMLPVTLNVKQVAELFNVSVPTAREFLHRKGVPPFKVGRELRIEKNALINYVQNAIGRCSHKIVRVQSKMMERMMRIELTQPAWKAGVLPLNYTRR